ncbi:MAG: septum formation initiator family protein [Pseudomonadota bacterium]
MTPRVWIALLLIVTAGLQHKLWLSDVGRLSQANLEVALNEQQAQLAELRERNSALTAEALALKSGPEALEARARKDLGMVRAGEVFYFVPDAP